MIKMVKIMITMSWWWMNDITECDKSYADDDVHDADI